MIQQLLSEEEYNFLILNAAVIKKDGKTLYALPVFVHVHNDPVDVFTILEGGIKNFGLVNAQQYLNMTVDSNMEKVSDGFHTFDELYDHRIINFIIVCKTLNVDEYAPIWRSKVHSDGTEWKGRFILGINSDLGEQITYHLPMKYWELTNFVSEYDTAPPFDGHTSVDVLERLKKLLKELES